MKSKKHYEGKRCRKCGSTLRYISNHNCVTCVKRFQSKWRKENPEKHRDYQLKYNWRRRNDIRVATPPWADHDAIDRMYTECERLSKTMGLELTVVHDIPLRGRTVCGLHVSDNLRVVSKSWIRTMRLQRLRKNISSIQ